MDKFKIGDKVVHTRYGKGIIIGNRHKRGEIWYWQVYYPHNESFGFSSEGCLTLEKDYEKIRLQKVLNKVLALSYEHNAKLKDHQDTLAGLQLPDDTIVAMYKGKNYAYAEVINILKEAIGGD